MSRDCKCNKVGYNDLIEDRRLVNVTIQLSNLMGGKLWEIFRKILEDLELMAYNLKQNL